MFLESIADKLFKFITVVFQRPAVIVGEHVVSVLIRQVTPESARLALNFPRVQQVDLYANR